MTSTLKHYLYLILVCIIKNYTGFKVGQHTAIPWHTFKNQSFLNQIICIQWAWWWWSIGAKQFRFCVIDFDLCINLMYAMEWLYAIIKIFYFSQTKDNICWYALLFNLSIFAFVIDTTIPRNNHHNCLESGVDGHQIGRTCVSCIMSIND